MIEESSLRWHYPDQVLGSVKSSLSQPLPAAPPSMLQMGLYHLEKTKFKNFQAKQKRAHMARQHLPWLFSFIMDLLSRKNSSCVMTNHRKIEDGFRRCQTRLRQHLSFTGRCLPMNKRTGILKILATDLAISP